MWLGHPVEILDEVGFYLFLNSTHTIVEAVPKTVARPGSPVCLHDLCAGCWTGKRILSGAQQTVA